MKCKFWIALLFISGLLMSCKSTNEPEKYAVTDGKALQKNIFPKDTLHVVTQYGATSYFNYRDEILGYDYELAQNLAAHLHLTLKVEVAKNDREMTDYLRTGKADLAIYTTYETKALKQEFNFVFAHDDSYLVLVQMMGRDAVSDPIELTGKEVWVKKHSIDHERLEALNEEIGGGIIIKTNDTLNTDDLMLQVAAKKIKYTIAYRNKALLQKIFNRTLDCRIPIGFSQRNGWLVRKDDSALRDSIGAWSKLDATNYLKEKLYGKYWEKNPYFAFKKIPIPKGSISPYDNIFKKHAKDIGWDWQLLAALAFVESGYDSTVVSWAGAKGIMQLMPQTALDFGVDQYEIENPEKNIAAGVEYIKSLNMIYRRIADKEERIKFILASYNCGPAHILDAMALAEKYGKNPHVWYDSVEYYLAKKSDPEFYNDPVVKYGFFRAKEPIRYVPNVLDTYNKYMGIR